MTTKLINQVGKKISLKIGTGTSPDQDQVVDWLNEGLRTLKRLLPYDYFINSASITTATGGEPAAPQVGISASAPAKIYMVTYAPTETATERPCKLIDAETYMGIKSGVNILKTPSDTYPLATIMNGKIYTLGGAASAATGVTKVYMVINGTALGASSTSASEHPIIDKLIVDYAVAQAKASDDELNAWQGKVQEFYKSVMDFNFGDVPPSAIRNMPRVSGGQVQQ